MQVCPKDLKPCCDDICYGAGCIRTGEEMIEVCHNCHDFIIDGECQCEEDLDHDWDEEDISL